MPVLLEGATRFPVAYAPWYVYNVNLVAVPAAFQIFDVLVPDADGRFDRLTTDDASLETGYAFALEKFKTGMKEVQVAVVGSMVPFVAGGTLRPLSLVKFNYAAAVQNAVAANAADLAAGRVIGRYRCLLDSNNDLSNAVTDDLILIHSGCV